METEIKQRIIHHWQSFKNPMINDILINLEKLEHVYPQLTPEGEEKVQTLLDALEKSTPDQVDEMSLIQMLNQLPAAYMLYIIHKLQSLNTDVVMKIISFAQKQRSSNDEVAKFFQRNMVFEKSQLLGRIFSTSRMEAVLDVLIKMNQR